MYNTLKKIKFLLEFIRCLPHLLVYISHKDKKIINADIRRWLTVLSKNYSNNVGLIFLLSFYKAFRNLFYYRIGNLGYIFNIFCPQISTLEIDRDQDIGEGLFIWHGYSTGIYAKSIGKNCTLNQQVSIGNMNGAPTILDNVTIYTGAVIMGNITIGNNVVIGANSTVFQDVPDNSTVYPATPRIMKWKDKNITSTI